ncbi:MAG: L-threonylcarbamoyladenylate synthase [Pseudomonadota bacterium]
MTQDMRRAERLEGEAGVARAATLLRSGALVSFPTETVYGLGADARNSDAVQGIFAAKGRPHFNPLIVHVPSFDAAGDLAEMPDWAEVLAQAFWPGALTLVAPHRGTLPDAVTAGRATVALRVPAHPLALQLLDATGRPLAAPSANPSGRVSPTTADHVLDGLDGKIAAVLDGGPTQVGLESTIIGGPTPTLLRPGGVPAEAIEAALGAPLAAAPPQAANAPSAPGQLASHYAPNAPVRLNALHAAEGEVHLGFGPVAGDVTLSASGDLHEAASRLFALLREIDRLGKPIAVAPVPMVGLGVAINDRLKRAAAPR